MPIPGYAVTGGLRTHLTITIITPLGPIRVVVAGVPLPAQHYEHPVGVGTSCDRQETKHSYSEDVVVRPENGRLLIRCGGQPLDANDIKAWSRNYS